MMMKTFLLAVCALSATAVSSTTYAADNFALFQSNGQLTVLMNEIGQNGKLAKLFGAFVSENDLNQFRWRTNDSATPDVTVACNRGNIAEGDTVPYSCTLTFMATANVTITSSSMVANVGDLTSQSLVNETFTNSSNQTFSFEMMSAGLAASAVFH
jgi:hypothetical protein